MFGVVLTASEIFDQTFHYWNIELLDKMMYQNIVYLKNIDKNI